MARLFGILEVIAIAALTACSSGVSNEGAGGAGTDTGGTDLVATMGINTLEFSVNAFAVDQDGDPIGSPQFDPETSSDIQGTSASEATLTINLYDPLGRYSRVFQGVTFTQYQITYEAKNGGAPSLGPRTLARNLTIILSGNTGEGSVDIPIVDNVTKTQFAKQASGSTVYNYVVRIRAIGRDFVNNSRVVVQTNATVEIGLFDTTAGN